MNYESVRRYRYFILAPVGHKTENDDATTTVPAGGDIHMCIQSARFFAHKAIRNTEHLRKALAKIFTFTRVSDGSCSSLCLPIILMWALERVRSV